MGGAARAEYPWRPSAPGVRVAPLNIRIQCLCIDTTDPAKVASFWEEALGWRRNFDEDDQVVLEPPAGSPEDGIARDVLFLRVSEPTQTATSSASCGHSGPRSLPIRRAAGRETRSTRTARWSSTPSRGGARSRQASSPSYRLAADDDSALPGSPRSAQRLGRPLAEYNARVYRDAA